MEATQAGTRRRICNAPPTDPGIGDGNGKGHGSLGAECQTLHRGNRLLSRRWKWLPMAFVIVIEPPFARGLVLLRHRLAASQIARNAVRVGQVHEASARLPQVPTEARQSGSGQAEPPDAGVSEGSSTASLLGRLSWSGTA